MLGVVKYPPLVSKVQIVCFVGYDTSWHTYSLVSVFLILNLIPSLTKTLFESSSTLISFNLAVISALDKTFLISSSAFSSITISKSLTFS